MPTRPLIAIAPDVVEPRPGSVRAQCALTYARAVAAAGGLPIVVAPLIEEIPEYLSRFDGFVLTGGDDPKMEAFGEPTHPKASIVHPTRQAFDTALLEALSGASVVPTLGICLGMQMMALTAGGRLNQYMPDTLPSHAAHYQDAVHEVTPTVASVIEAGRVTSHHRQAVSDPGRMRVIGMSPDGVIEAIDRPGCPFFVGVQWHPERTEDRSLGVGLLERFVQACWTRQSKPGSR